MTKREGLPPSHQVWTRLDGWTGPPGVLIDPSKIPAIVAAAMEADAAHRAEVAEIKARMVVRMRVIGIDV